MIPELEQERSRPNPYSPGDPIWGVALPRYASDLSSESLPRVCLTDTDR
jgi:hypothetical protein